MHRQNSVFTRVLIPQCTSAPVHMGLIIYKNKNYYIYIAQKRDGSSPSSCAPVHFLKNFLHLFLFYWCTGAKFFEIRSTTGFEPCTSNAPVMHLYALGNLQVHTIFCKNCYWHYFKQHLIFRLQLYTFICTTSIVSDGFFKNSGDMHGEASSLARPPPPAGRDAQTKGRQPTHPQPPWDRDACEAINSIARVDMDHVDQCFFDKRVCRRTIANLQNFVNTLACHVQTRISTQTQQTQKFFKNMKN